MPIWSREHGNGAKPVSLGKFTDVFASFLPLSAAFFIRHEAAGTPNDSRHVINEVIFNSPSLKACKFT
jgi:hypothetical protein